MYSPDCVAAVFSIIGILVSQSQVAIIGPITFGFVGILFFVIGIVGFMLNDNERLSCSSA